MVSFHTSPENQGEWNMQEIAETVQTIFPLRPEEKEKINGFSNPQKEKIDAVEERTNLLNYLQELAALRYEELLVRKATDPRLIIEVEKQMLLRSIDTLWVEHLVAIDYLRTGIGLRGYGQRDPLVEYKKETYRMFNELLAAIQKELVYSIYKMSIGIQLAPSVMESQKLELQGAAKTTGDDGKQKVETAKHTNADGKEIGRNDLCYCGSGKKFKKCHGA
jgi:preprotein translocase subunit SecA